MSNKDVGIISTLSNWVFASNFDFLISISLQHLPNLAEFVISNYDFILDEIIKFEISADYAPSGCKYTGIRRTQFQYKSIKRIPLI